MIPSGRLAVVLGVPMLLAVAWVAVPAVLPLLLVVDAGIAVVALLDLVASGASLTATRAVGPVQAVGRPVDVRYTVSSATWRSLHVRLDDEGPGVAPTLPAAFRLPAHGRVELVAARVFPRRGRATLVGLTLRWSSPLGLWWRQRRTAVPAAVRVYPDFSFLRQSAMRARAADAGVPTRARRRPGGESEFERNRPYVPGDSMRHVDWKATARRGQLVTREFGQEVAQNVVLVLDTGRAASLAHGERLAFDEALHAALALAHGALRRGDRVGLLAFDREVRAWSAPRGGVPTITRLVGATYDLFPRLEESDPAVAFRHLAARLRRRSLVVVLTAATDSTAAEAMGAVVRGLAGRHLPVVVWLEDPRFEAIATGPAPTDDPEAPFRRAAAAEIVRWRAATLEAWRRAGALVVDVPADRLSAELLSRYLEIKARRLL